TYSLTGGADQALFSIDTNTGVLTFNAAPDFETPGDVNTDNVYEVQVKVADSAGLTDVQDLQVTVTNLNCPTIQFTFVPSLGSFEDLEGEVCDANPLDHGVAVYIQVDGGWWTKPFFDHPLTSIDADGTFSVDITTGDFDHLATKIAAFLVSGEFSPPLASGENKIPQDVFDHALAYEIVDRSRTIEWSGSTWQVKASNTLVGPGPNTFSDREEDVYVDEQGRLHLTITQRDGRWWATEVVSEDVLEFGTYMFRLASDVTDFPPTVVLGLFTWDPIDEFNHREIDIEFSKWGDAGNPNNAQYVVQPFTTAGNIFRFNVPNLAGEVATTHSFEWNADRVQFRSISNQPAGSADIVTASWNYSGEDVPPAGSGNVRLNLWLLDGTPPSDQQSVEAIIEDFTFIQE
ncbi:MAG: hypothetical protein JSV66_13565, partial [Trueperaceae bacterium]